MNKFKKIPSIFALSTVLSLCNASAIDPAEPSKSISPSLSGIPDELRPNIASYLPAEELLNFSQTSKAMHTAAIDHVVTTYATCILNNEPVSELIMPILREITNPTEQQNITNRIVSTINQKGLFYRGNPVPPFLAPYFRSLTPDERNNTLENLVKQGVLPAAAQHMKTIDNTKSDEDALTIIKQQLTDKSHTYITLDAALALPDGAPMPHHIIITNAELEANSAARLSNIESPEKQAAQTRFNAIVALLQNNPTHEIVLDFSEDSTVPNSFGYNDDVLKHVKKLSLIGSNLTSIGDYFMPHNRSIVNLRLPEGITAIGHMFFSANRANVSMILPRSLSSLGQEFFFSNNATSHVAFPLNLEAFFKRNLDGSNSPGLKVRFYD
jgi:hypothetical protein